MSHPHLKHLSKDIEDIKDNKDITFHVDSEVRAASTITPFICYTR